jgi:predicted RNase H-like HicB family nuclease
MKRQVIIYPGEDGYWVAECPSLPACISQGKTKTEAIANIKEAIELYIEVLNIRMSKCDRYLEISE